MKIKFLSLVLALILISCKKETFIQETDPITTELALQQLEISYNKSMVIEVRTRAVEKGLSLLNAYKDTTYVKLLYQKCIFLFYSEQYDKFHIENENLLRITDSIDDVYHKGKINYLNAYYFDKVKIDKQRAFYFYNESKNDFLKISNSSEAAKKLLNMAYIQRNMGDYFGSEETITQAIPLFKEENDKKYLASSYNVLATNLRQQYNYIDSEFYFSKAIKTTDIEKDKLIYLNNLSALYIESEKYPKAIQLLDSLLDKVETPIQKARILDNLTYAKWLDNDIVQTNDFTEALEIRRANNDKQGLLASYTHLGEYHSKSNPTKALEYLDNAANLAYEVKSPQGELDALKFSLSISPNKQRLSRYLFLNDSIKKEELTAKSEFAKIKYDATQKQEELDKIKILNLQQQNALTIQKNQKIVFLLISFLLLLSLIFAFVIFKNRIKRKTMESAYEEANRISIRLHDEVANDVSALLSSVNQSNKFKDPSDQNIFLDNLEDIYLRTRDFAARNAAIDTEDFHESIKSLLLKFQQDNTKIMTNLTQSSELLGLSKPNKIALYRSLQELSVNSFKNSGANNISIMQRTENKNLIITYKDDGCGTELHKIKKRGLGNVENRMNSINGSCSFESQPNSGFKAILKLPLKP